MYNNIINIKCLKLNK